MNIDKFRVQLSGYLKSCLINGLCHIEIDVNAECINVIDLNDGVRTGIQRLYIEDVTNLCVRGDGRNRVGHFLCQHFSLLLSESYHFYFTTFLSFRQVFP